MAICSQPRLQLAIRRGTEVFRRDEREWSLARTQWTRFFLDAKTRSLSEQITKTEASVSYDAPRGGVIFLTKPFLAETEITGPLALRLWVSFSTDDLDLFVTIRNLDSDGNEIHGIGSSGDLVVVTKCWLRVSLRKIRIHNLDKHSMV